MARADAQSMTTAPAAPAREAHETPSGWIAFSNVYPRIGVTAPSETEALRLLDVECAAWVARDDERRDD
jgi:hypothetical protein